MLFLMAQHIKEKYTVLIKIHIFPHNNGEYQNDTPHYFTSYLFSFYYLLFSSFSFLSKKSI